MSSSTTTSIPAPKRSRKSATTPRRVWTSEEERTLVDGLKELCVNGWRGDNGTFRHGYLLELERYMHARHPNCGIRALPNVDSKIRTWKKAYATLSALKNRSGLGFQYSDGTIIVDSPKAWDDFVKMDPNAKVMNLKKWPLFGDWEEIFGRDRATGEFAEGPQDAVEEMENAETQDAATDIYFICDGSPGGDAPTAGENQAAQDEPNESTRAPQSPHTQNEPNVATGAGHGSFTGGTTQSRGTQQAQNQGNNSKESSSKAKEKEKGKRKRTNENEPEVVITGLVDAMKQFSESNDKVMGVLAEKLGERDLSEIRKKIFSILASPEFEWFTKNQRAKAAMGLTQDLKKMEYFLGLEKEDRQFFVCMIINEEL